jgi:hypothetical protein
LPVLPAGASSAFPENSRCGGLACAIAPPTERRCDLSFPKFDPTEIRVVTEDQSIIDAMFAIIYLLGTFIADLFKSRRRLEIENLFLRH